MDRKTAKSAFAVEFIDIEQAAQESGADWEWHQIEFLDIQDHFSTDIKARQIAWSFTAALDAVVDSILSPGNPHIFTSINLDESKEKIRYAKNILEAIDPQMRPKLARPGSQTELEFANGSRILSHPQRPPRGKPGARIYLDEFAHYQDGMDREIFKGAVPATTRKGGYIRIGSSPAGAKGLFWEIQKQSLRKWPGFVRRAIPWWLVTALCANVFDAAINAPMMLTQDRVEKYGTETLKVIFENMFLEDFQQEYECWFVDESTAWISWELIKKNQQGDDFKCWHAKSVDEALSMIPAIKDAMYDGTIEKVLYGGMDIGRHRNLTELIMVGKATTGSFPIRFMVSLDNVEYDDQEKCLITIAKELKPPNILVDQNGIGDHLAENASRATGRVMGVTFSNPTKEMWAVQSRIEFERGNAQIPRDRELAYQIHSIKKKITAAKNNVFDTEKNEKHHADKFWAHSLALWAAQDAYEGDDQVEEQSLDEIMGGFRG